MSKFAKFAVLSVCVALLAVAVPAKATTPLIDIGFNNLTGTFNGATKVFTATDNSVTNGSVQRLMPPTGTAYYVGPFAGSADFTMSMNISNVTASTADGAGSFTIIDVDGTTFLGDLNGTWTYVNLGIIKYASFAGLVTNAVFGGNADGTFDGPNGGSFSTDFSPISMPLYGAIVTLRIGEDWFTGPGFTGTVENLVIKIIPAPGALLLAALGLGGLGLIRRRFSA